MRGSDRVDRDWVVPPEGSRSTGGNHACRSKSHPYGLRPRGFPHQDSGYTGNTEQMVWKMWGAVHGNLPRLHGGGLLVLCETQGMTLLRGMRTGNRHLWGLDRRDTTG
jgi:hypothetical protein